MIHNFDDNFQKSQYIYPSDIYSSCDDLWVITCYFNPNHYQTKLENYKIFQSSISKSKIKLFTIECVFNDSAFELAASDSVLQVRADSVLWQKERLLNIILDHLPPNVKKIAWIDCDILFSNYNWAIETSALLNSYPIVQPYHTVIRLPRTHRYYQGQSDGIWSGCAYVLDKNASLISKGNFHLHGHTGMAWAGQVDILKKHGFYDACISGSGDHLMCHAMYGTFYDPCIKRTLGDTKIRNKLFRHFVKWAYPFYLSVQGRVGFVKGEVLHLWHGSSENRKYVQRHEELIKLGFDPFVDLKKSENGSWTWGTRTDTRLKEWTNTYFSERKEDGEIE
jgi:hypothetical protein